MAVNSYNPELSIITDQEMTQKEVVLEHLREYDTITALQGLQLYGIGNVQGRIADLRLDGHDIATHQDTPHDYATYELIDDA